MEGPESDQSKKNEQLFNKNGFFGQILDLEQEDDIERFNRIGENRLDNLLDEFRKLDCSQKEEEKTSPEYCHWDKQANVFNNLGSINFSPMMLFDQFKKNIYDPLGYKVYKDYNFTNIIQQMVQLSKEQAMIHPEISIPTRDEFVDEQLSKFDFLQDLSFDFNKNKE